MSNRDLIRRLRAMAFDPDGVPGHLIDEAADALEAHEWNTDMDAAPRDGTEILAFCECGNVMLIRWCPNDKEESRYRGKGGWCAGKDVGEEVIMPCVIAWKHLDAPPDRTGKE